MITQDELESIKKSAIEFFKKMTFDVLISAEKQDDDTVLLNVKTEDPKILIGQGGQTLVDLQFLLKGVLRKKIEKPFYLDLDINNYKEKKLEYLKQSAVSAADDVSFSKTEKVLPIMSASERRVVHMELKNRQDIKTESRGEGENRRIVIVPKE
jgi:spoIIIJ-associated protein